MEVGGGQDHQRSSEHGRPAYRGAGSALCLMNPRDAWLQVALERAQPWARGEVPEEGEAGSG